MLILAMISSGMARAKELLLLVMDEKSKYQSCAHWSIIRDLISG